MRRAVAFFVGLALACSSPPDGAEREPSPRALFDGLHLTGWEGDPRFWRVEEGAIVGESSAANPCRETTYLVWRGSELGDFELELEWRFPAASLGANSGVQFRSQARSPLDVVGYQADLETGADWTGGLYEQGGRGVVTRRGERVVLDAAGAKTIERFADGERLLAAVVPGAWNRLRVAAFGPRLSIAVNGELFSETIDLDPARAARSGTLALQLHAGPPMRVEYRGLELRELAHAPHDPGRTAAARAAPEWIWPGHALADGQRAWFRRRFELDAAPARAELWISGDNHVDAWIGGQGVATSDDWGRPVRVDVLSRVEAGANELLVRVENDEREAGLVLVLTLELQDGRRVVLTSDASFEACLEPPEGVPEPRLGAWLDEGAVWQPARSFGALGVAPWGLLGDEVVASGEAPEAETITVPAGFRVERLYSVPLGTQGSWVALALDPLGRFYASDQYGGLFRISVPPLGSSGATSVEPLPLALGEAHGLLWAHDSLYAVVSGAGEYASGLYRARDSDGDGELDRVECLRAFEGDGEHGPHGVVLAPDGALFVVGGNYTELPGPFERSRLPATWGEDALLPPLYDPNGHALEIRAPGGWIVRTDPEGASWELFAAGFRNPYDAAFNADGELFTYDSDMEWDVGLPWYKPTRVYHVVSGGEYGWRTGSTNWPADSYDALPAAVDLGLGSPTGIVFGTETGFPQPWKGALFACDWAYGRILAVHLEPAGSSYRGRYEVFASGEPFPVTDAVVGPDGALYVTIGGRQTQSGLYRIAWGGAAPPEESTGRPPGEFTRRSAEFMRRARRSLEEHGHDGKELGAPAQEAAPDLGSWHASGKDVLVAVLLFSDLDKPDRFFRHAARIALEHLDPELCARLVRAENDPRAALEGWLALVRSDPSTDAHEVSERALGIFATSAERAERLDALRLLELVLIRLEAGDGVRARIRAALDGAYPSGDARLDRALLGLLVSFGADVAERALAQLERAATQEDRIAILYSLRALEAHWTEARGRRLLAAFERELASAQGGLSVRGYLQELRAEACQRTGLSAESSPADPVGSAALAARSPLGASRATHPWTLAELEPRLAEVARARSFERGRDAYLAASCQQCHRFAGEGANLGPDLTGAAGRYSARDLLVAILEPEREVPDVWRDTEFWGEDALLAVGRLESEREGELLVRETSGASARLAAALVTEQRPHRLSRMPEGLVDALTGEEILDLLAFVLSGGDALDARFR